jgi:hypothetical protein
MRWNNGTFRNKSIFASRRRGIDGKSQRSPPTLQGWAFVT